MSSDMIFCAHIKVAYSDIPMNIEVEDGLSKLQNYVIISSMLKIL